MLSKEKPLQTEAPAPRPEQLPLAAPKEKTQQQRRPDTAAINRESSFRWRGAGNKGNREGATHLGLAQSPKSRQKGPQAALRGRGLWSRGATVAQTGHSATGTKKADDKGTRDISGVTCASLALRTGSKDH